MDHLPNTTTKFHKRILLMWACAVMWIYIGNIINFHQHHIWGKQLIPVACANNRTKEKSLIKYLGSSNDHSLSLGSSSWLNAVDLNSVHGSFNLAGIISFPYIYQSLCSFRIQGKPLRAPPLA